jgi:hypothetical protein
MTKKQAKKITLEVWTYLRDHPEIKYKSDLPDKLWYKIKKMVSTCPLCHIFTKKHITICGNCPLGTELKTGCPYWKKWCISTTDQYRTKAASKIVELVKAWKV